jgi:alpha-glucosidase
MPAPRFPARCAVLFAVVLFLCASLTFAQQTAAGSQGRQWWQGAVFYEVYPRSFADSDNDGIGDLNGITSKLDYLKQLGVDAIWITPCFPSPQVDFGYDVADYENIDPMYGTLQDFDHLLSEANKRGIRVILDFVMNHTSDQHKWFLDSESSRDSAHRDWYIWRDGKGPGQPPNNWLALFGGSAWQFDPKTGQYYYHAFYPQQPDLNWRSPAVEKAMFDTTRFWYQRGVAGFRLDAVDTLFEDPELRGNPIRPGLNSFGLPNMEPKYTSKLPEVHDVLRDLRKVADGYDAVLIGETWTSNINELKEYYGQHGNELQMPMDLMFATVNKLSAPEFRRQIAAADASGGWPVYLVGNHDVVRSYNRYGDGQHNDQIAKLMAALYLTLRGSAIMYYGEEIGMENNDPKSKDDVKDPMGKLGWPIMKGRDGERTPMQWTNGANGGFSTATPWLPVPASAKTHNVESESKNPDSILNFYKRLLSVRHTEKALLYGEYIALNTDDPNVLSYLRRYQDDAVLVILNMSASEQSITFDLSSLGLLSPTAQIVLTNQREHRLQSPLRYITLDPFAAYILKVSR